MILFHTNSFKRVGLLRKSFLGVPYKLEIIVDRIVIKLLDV